MSLIVKKEPWKRFAIKALAVFAILWCLGSAFAGRFRIGIDTQQDKCIPGYNVYLIDKQDKNLERGGIYAFSAKGLMPFYEDNTPMVKYLTGLPGDSVRIQRNGDIYINNRLKGSGLGYADRLKKTPDFFAGTTQLKPNQYWFMGSSHQSFDSRYWGAVGYEQIIGRAYPII